MSGIPEFKKKAIIFLIKFFVIYTILQFLILALPLEFVENGIAEIEANAIGARAEGNMIEGREQSFQIVPNCTGLVGISILAAIIFSLRKPELKKKLVLLGIGTVILFPLNLLRIYFVLRVSILSNAEIGEILHMTTWFISAATILVIWYYLTKKVAKVKRFNELL